MAGGVTSADKRARIAMVRSLLSSGTPTASIIDWLTTTQQAQPAYGIEAKPWTVSRQTARKYIDAALESIDVEIKQPADRKKARNRGVITLILQKLIAKGDTTSLRAALVATDQLCRIDGSYETGDQPGALGLPEPATPEEAAVLIEHAAATLALARARGAMPAAPEAKVIDVEATEADEAADEAPADPVESPGHAN